MVEAAVQPIDVDKRFSCTGLVALGEAGNRLPFWREAAAKLHWNVTEDAEGLALIKRRLTLVERHILCRARSARHKVQTWSQMGGREVEIVGQWGRLGAEAKVARLLIATPEAALAIVGSTAFRPSSGLLALALEKGVKFSSNMLYQTWGCEFMELVLDNLKDGHAPDSHHLCHAVRMNRSEFVQLLWERGVRPIPDHMAQIRGIEGESARWIAARLGEDQESVLGSRLVSSDDAPTETGTGPDKRARRA